MSLSLQQKKILITRDHKQARDFSEKIKAYDGIPIEVPLLRIACKPKERERIQDLDSYDWIFFTSANGVECFFQWIKDVQLSSSIAVVGHKTEQALKKYGYQADFIPTTYNAEVMAKEFLVAHPSVNNILLVRGNISRDVLPKQFSKHRLQFDMVEVYETTFNDTSKVKLQQMFSTAHAIDFITFTSPSTVDACMQFLTESSKENMLSKECVCIGTTTARRAQAAGFRHILIPDMYTVEGMIKRISTYLNKERIDF